MLAAAHSVPGVDYVDVDVFTGVPASATPDELAGLAQPIAGPPQASVPARAATYDEKIHTVTRRRTARRCRRSPPGTASRSPNSCASTPTSPTPGRLAKGRSVFVFRGIRPAQLALFSPQAADTLILTEVK